MARRQRPLDQIKAIVVASALKDHADADFCEFLADEIFAERTNLSSPTSLEDLLTDHLTVLPLNASQITSLCNEFFVALSAAGLLPSAQTEPEEQVVEKKGCPDHIPLSDGKFARAFKKEIDARKRSSPEIPANIMACKHDWFNEHSGGERCMVCDFETTKTVWNCQRCPIALCGSCCYKWKKL